MCCITVALIGMSTDTTKYLTGKKILLNVLRSSDMLSDMEQFLYTVKVGF